MCSSDLIIVFIPFLEFPFVNFPLAVIPYVEHANSISLVLGTLTPPSIVRISGF